MNIQRILFPTDFSECSNAALDHALFLAEHLGADLDLLHAVVLHDLGSDDSSQRFPNAEAIYSRLQDVATSDMRELLDAHTTDHLNLRELTRRAVAAAPAIVDFANDEKVDLIVMGAHGRRGFRRFLLGSVTEEVVRLAPCPVLTIRGTGDAAKLHKPNKILVPFDFSKPSHRALSAAGRLSESYGARVYLLHVLEPILEPHPYVPVHYRPESFDMGELMAQVKSDLDTVAADLTTAGVSHDVKVLEGHPAASITEYADAIDAGLIAMATHGRTGLSRFFLGSVTERVVRSASCPVLTLKFDDD